jgi:hypothetical protein
LFNTAYWIAFGPHGPRSAPPPNETQKVILYTAIGIGASFVIFASMRMFAKPGPSTMTKEWQEATNEFLKVGILSRLLPPLLSAMANLHLPTGPKLGPLDRSLVRRLHWQGPCAVPLVQGIDYSCFHLLIDATFDAGERPCNRSLGRNFGGGGALGLAGADIGWCKYCTTLTMRHRFLSSRQLCQHC